MHSIFMRTARSLIASRSIHQGEVCMPRGHACLGVCACIPRGMCPPTPHPPVERMTDACEKITLPHTSFADSNNRLVPLHLPSFWDILDPPPERKLLHLLRSFICSVTASTTGIDAIYCKHGYRCRMASSVL